MDEVWSTPPRWWREGDPLVTVTTAWGPAVYPLCLASECGLPVGTITGSPMRDWGLGLGWTSWECASGHRYAYQAQDGVISHASARREA